MALWYRPDKQPELDGEGSDGEEYLTAGVSKEMDLDDWQQPDEAEPPSLEFRFECAKLLLELDESVETAIEVMPM